MDAQQNRIFTAILIIALVLGTVIIYFLISMWRQQRKNILLHKKNITSEINQIEKERARIAHDLHDELGPLLSAVKMKINSFELTDKEDMVQIKKTNDHMDEALKRIREISFGLMPNSLLRKGLIPAVREYVDYLNSNSKISFHFTFQKDIKVPENNAVNFYRIIQESVHNTIKHSHASEVFIDLENSGDNIVLSIRDNGVGFDYANESKDNIGFGLQGLLRRTEIMNGKMFVESIRNSGTSYTFEIPAR